MNNEALFFEELTKEVAKQDITNATKLNNLKITLAKKHNLKRVIKNAEIIAHAPSEIRNKIISLMNIKPVRTSAGVTVVALFAKPHKCPHGKCIYCPGGIGSEFGDTPQSYTGAEPAALRAIRNSYDPYKQIFNRLEHYVVNGHFPDKLELIFMGGTFPSLDKNYRDEFVYYTYKAINDFASEFVILDENKNKYIDYDKFNEFFETSGDFQSKKREENILKKVEELKNKKQLRIGIDIDEVLAELLESFLKYYNKKFGTKHKIDDFKSYDWSTVLNNTMDELVKLVDEFYEQGDYEKLPCVNDSSKFLKELSMQNKLYVITSRPIEFEQMTINWLSKNYGDIFEKVIFSNNGHTGKNNSSTKAQICQLYKLDLHIEDVFSYAKDCSENGTKVLLYDRPWNRERTETNNIKRVKNWQEISEEIRKLKEQKDYNTEIKKCEKGLIRPIGLTIETKPDWAKEEHLKEMLNYGATRLEIGIQSLNDDILKRIGRGHGIKEVIESLQIAKDMCFKINAHMMVGLPFSSEEEDLNSFKNLFGDQRFRPDMIKIYPCLVTKGTQLYDMFQKGIYKHTDTKKAAKIIAEAYKYFPRYTRVMRVQRDIPTPNIIGGVLHSNLRQFVEEEMHKQNIISHDIREREIGLRTLKGIKTGTFKLKTTEYESSSGTDFFIESCDENDTLIGFARLRFPSKYGYIKEIEEKTALIRELHVYGTISKVTGEKGLENREEGLETIESLIPSPQSLISASQHKGWGKKLVAKAEEISTKKGYKKIAIISGIGVREYYEKLGYKLEGHYMTKYL